MKKFFLLGCVVLGFNSSAMEKVISQPMSDLTLTDEAIHAMAVQAVAHYDAVLMSNEDDSLEEREKAYKAFYAYLQSLASHAHENISDAISCDLKRADIYGYHLIYMDDKALRAKRIQAEFVQLSECAKEAVLEFLIGQRSSLLRDLIRTLNVDQLSNCGFCIEEMLSNEQNDAEYSDEKASAFMQVTRRSIKRLLTKHYDAIINPGQPVQKFRKSSAICSMMRNYLTSTDELFLAQFDRFLGRYTQEEQEALLECLVLEYGCANFKQATQVVNVISYLLEACSKVDVNHKARMLIHIYHLFNQMYPKTGALVNTYAKYCDARARVLDALGECVATYQAGYIFSFLCGLGRQDNDPQALIEEAKKVEIPEALKHRILWKLLCWDDHRLLNTIHHQESYLHGVIEVVLPRFLSHDDFCSFIDGSEIIAWHQQVGIQTPFRDILYLYLGHLVPVVNLGQYERVIAEYTELLAQKNATAAKP